MNLTYDDVVEICNVNEAFKLKQQKFGNTLVAQCTYFLAKAGDFFDAKKDKSMFKATELRGITFTKEDGQTEWTRHLFIDKFFNINQTNGTNDTWMNLTINGKTIKCNINKLYLSDKEKSYRALDLKVGMLVGEFDRTTETVGELFTIETLEKEILPVEITENSWMYDDIKDLKLLRIADKEDGSAVRFLRINGNLMAKTKFSFEADQVHLAMNVVNANNELKKFINKTLDNRLVALFEIVSPFNKVVLSYNETSLRLLQLRDEETGEYLDIYNNDMVKQHNIVCAAQEPLELVEKVAQKYTIDEAKEKLGNSKFNSLQEFLNFLNDTK